MKPPVVSQLYVYIMAACGGVLCAYAAAALPLPLPNHTLFYDDFESQVLDPSFWLLSGGENALPIVLPQYGNMGVRFEHEIHERRRSELTLRIDLADYEAVHLSFTAKAKGVHDPPPDEPFENGCDGAGIAVSTDNSNWYPVHDLSYLTRTPEQVVVDLDEAIASWPISYTDPFYIRIFFFVSFGCIDMYHSNCAWISDLHVVGVPRSVFNYGHAPDPPYPTMRISDGARHVAGGDIRLGERASVDRDGPGATESRDGVQAPEFFHIGETSEIIVTVPVASRLDAWFDFNDGGAWSAAEKVFDGAALEAGDNTLTVTVPDDAVPSDRVYARFRVSSVGGLAPVGAYDDGEVEDYPIIILPRIPETTPLPPYAGGHEVTIQWEALAPEHEHYYEVQSARTGDFSSIEASSGWIKDTAYTFGHLEDEQTYFYRVRAGKLMPPRQAVWRQNRAVDFLSGTVQDVGLCDNRGVHLAPASHASRTYIFKEDVFDSPIYYPLPAVNRGYVNVFAITRSVLLEEFAMYLELFEPGPIEFVVYEGGAAQDDPFTRILTVVRDVEAGAGFFGSGPVVPPLVLQQGIHYSIGLCGPDEYDLYYYNAVYNEPLPFAGFQHSKEFQGYPSPDGLGVDEKDVAIAFFTRLTTIAGLDHRTAGTYVSPIIARDANDLWSHIHYTTDVPAQTNVTVDVLSAISGNPISGYANIQSGHDLSGISAQAFQLRASLETEDPDVSPALSDWHVTRQTGEAYYLPGRWSEPLHVTPINTPPSVQAINLLDATPTRAETVRFELVFSQPVTIVPEAINDAVYVLHDPSGPEIGITGIEGSGAVYEVIAATGGRCGTLKLLVDATALITNIFNVPLTEGYADGPVYTLDFTPPAVHAVTRLDAFTPETWPAAWRVFFSEAVYNVSESDFVLTGAADAQIVGIQGSGAVYDIFMAPGESEGMAGLDVVVAAGGLVDQAGWPLAASYHDAPEYAIDFEAPFVTSITRLHPEFPETPEVAFEVVFSEPVFDVSPADFTLAGMADATITSVSGEDATYSVEILAGEMDGDARLNVVAGGGLRDWAGRPLRNDYRIGPAYIFDFNPPRVYVVALLDPPLTNMPVVRFLVQFNKAVYNLEDAAPFSDFEVGGSASGDIIGVEGDGALYTVAVDSGDVEGTLRLHVKDSGPLHDHMGRGLSECHDTGPAYQIRWLYFAVMPEETVHAYPGDSVTLAVVAASGTGTIEYQWYKSPDGIAYTPVIDADRPFMVLKSLDWDDAAYYYCQASDLYQVADSQPTQLIVEEVPLGVTALFWRFVLIVMVVSAYYGIMWYGCRSNPRALRERGAALDL